MRGPKECVESSCWDNTKIMIFLMRTVLYLFCVGFRIIFDINWNYYRLYLCLYFNWNLKPGWCRTILVKIGWPKHVTNPRMSKWQFSEFASGMLGSLTMLYAYTIMHKTLHLLCSIQLLRHYHDFVRVCDVMWVLSCVISVRDMAIGFGEMPNLDGLTGGTARRSAGCQYEKHFIRRRSLRGTSRRRPHRRRRRVGLSVVARSSIYVSASH